MASDVKKTANDVQGDVVQALSAVAKAALADELASVNQSIASLETRLQQRMREAQEESGRKIDSAREALSARVDELAKRLEGEKKERTETVTGLVDQINKSLQWIKQQTAANEQKTAASIEATKRGLEKGISSNNDQIHTELESINRTLGLLRTQIDEHQASINRSSVLLENMGRIFHAGQPLPESPATARADHPQKNPAASRSSMPAAPSQQPPSAAQGGQNTAETAGSARQTQTASNFGNDLPSGSDVANSLDGMFKRK